MPLALLMASEWWRREDYEEWSGWLDDSRYRPSPLLDATWELWLKVAPFYDYWIDYKLSRPLRWARRKAGVHCEPDESWREWYGHAMSPEEELLAIIEWDQDLTYADTRARWRTCIETRDEPQKAG